MSIIISDYIGSSEIGTYIFLTNNYCIVPYFGEERISNYKLFYSSIGSNTTLLETNIAGVDIIGRLIVGNSKGLILPLTATNKEIEYLTENLPDGVELSVVEEKLSALGNVIATNDKIALVHPELDKETIETIQDTLCVEVFPTTIGSQTLVGSYTKYNNKSGIVSPIASVEEAEELSNQLGINIEIASVNNKSIRTSSGLCVNDSKMIIGSAFTQNEISTVSRVFKIFDDQSAMDYVNDLDLESLL